MLYKKLIKKFLKSSHQKNNILLSHKMIHLNNKHIFYPPLQFYRVKVSWLVSQRSRVGGLCAWKLHCGRKSPLAWERGQCHSGSGAGVNGPCFLLNTN